MHEHDYDVLQVYNLADPEIIPGYSHNIHFSVLVGWVHD
jgi:hypothetical protein